MQHVRLAGVVSAHPRPGLKRSHRSDIENLPATLNSHQVTDRMAKPCEREDVQVDQVLFGTPVLRQKRSAGADARRVDQQVNLMRAVFQFQQEARKTKRLTEVACAKQHFYAETLRQLQGNCCQQIALAGNEDQAVTATCQRLGHGQTYAAGSAGDQGVTGHAVLHRTYCARRSAEP
ncbi:hypothetical protein ALP29_200205 [Pseudomonas syringae pv. avii]|uniref:Uncharacterized protein n=1 Tax=Pseudomonas syringae pv. avii TaxID=663959 RepID=A0A3M5TZR0_PSESX|nr:hypothetical protein ALP29_200205 [Pseudomonas syringae pv. avii]